VKTVLPDWFGYGRKFFLLRSSVLPVCENHLPLSSTAENIYEISHMPCGF